MGGLRSQGGGGGIYPKVLYKYISTFSVGRFRGLPATATLVLQPYPLNPVEKGNKGANTMQYKTLKEAMNEFKAQYIEEVLVKTGYNVSETARMLHIDRSYIYILGKRLNRNLLEGK